MVDFRVLDTKPHSSLLPSLPVEAVPCTMLRKVRFCHPDLALDLVLSVRLLYLTKGVLNDGILAGISKLRPHVPLTNRWKCRQTLQLDVLIHLALEFAIRRHLTVEISASAHLHPEFREFREL